MLYTTHNGFAGDVFNLWMSTPPLLCFLFSLAKLLIVVYNELCYNSRAARFVNTLVFQDTISFAVYNQISPSVHVNIGKIYLRIRMGME